MEEQNKLPTEFSNNSALQQLFQLNGLESVKDFILKQVQSIRLAKEKQFASSRINMVFKGNPRTGKTLVSSLVAKIYKEEGALSTGHVINVCKNDLVGIYVGETQIKTKTICQSAIGGVLFIDEVHSFNEPNNAYGKEALTSLLYQMEELKNDICFIFAGYPEQVDEFLNSNPGLHRRLNIVLDFDK